MDVVIQLEEDVAGDAGLSSVVIVVQLSEDVGEASVVTVVQLELDPVGEHSVVTVVQLELDPVDPLPSLAHSASYPPSG